MNARHHCIPLQRCHLFHSISHSLSLSCSFISFSLDRSINIWFYYNFHWNRMASTEARLLRIIKPKEIEYPTRAYVVRTGVVAVVMWEKISIHCTKTFNTYIRQNEMCLSDFRYPVWFFSSYCLLFFFFVVMLFLLDIFCITMTVCVNMRMLIAKCWCVYGTVAHSIAEIATKAQTTSTG